jgi:hypothetical protein
MYCHVWNEYTAKTTADDIISATWSFFLKNIDEKFTNWKIWSDNCVSQNTCWRILFFYAYLIKTKKVLYFKHLILTQNTVNCISSKNISSRTHIHNV